jgi:hypothetical protein
MPTVSVAVPRGTTVEIEVDVSDYADKIEVEIDEDVIVEAISNGDVDAERVLDCFGQKVVLRYVEKNLEVDDWLSDAKLIELIKGRSDLLKLALLDLDPSDLRGVAMSFLESAVNTPMGEAIPVVKLLVRHLLASEWLRLPVADAIGEHYAKAPLEPLVQAMAKAAK